MTVLTEGRKSKQVSQKVSKELGDADLQKQKKTQGRFLMLIANRVFWSSPQGMHTYGCRPALILV